MANPNNIFFHSAEVYIKPRVANPTPRRIAVLQEVSIEFKRDNKELFGENKYAEDVASGNESISGKYKSGELDPTWITEGFLAATRTTGMLLMARAELHTVALGATTATHASDFSEDYGIVNLATNKAYRRVAATPAAGEYTVNEVTGVYGFNTSENGNSLAHTYLYESTDGETYTVNNTAAGDSVYCSLFLFKNSRAQTPFGLRLANATFESASFGFKLNDYTMPEGSFKGFADSAGKVFQMFKG